WENEVRQPNTSHVDTREHGRLDYREDGHRLSRTVDGHTPLLTEQKKYSRNKRSCVTNTYPPNKVGNIPGPAYSFVQSPGTNTHTDGVKYTAYTPKEGN